MERKRYGRFNNIVLATALTLGLSACANDARGNGEFAAANLPRLDPSPTYIQEPTLTATLEPKVTFTPQPTMTPEPTFTPEPTAIPTKVPVVAPSGAESAAPVQANPVESTSLNGESILINEINRIRVQNGARSLSVDPYLMDFAQARAIAATTNFSHEDSAKNEYFKNYIYRYCNNSEIIEQSIEILGRNNHPEDPYSEVIRKWVGSSSHLRAILYPTWNTIGVGVAVGSDGLTYFASIMADGPCVI